MKVAEKFIVFNQPDLGEEEMSAVLDVIRSGWIGTGKVSHQFEEEFAEFCGGGYAVAVSSCTIGLQLALQVVRKLTDQANEVITSPLTFAATINAILACGDTPLFVDVDDSGCLDMKKVAGEMSCYTKAVLPIHYSGSICDFSKIKAPVIEDCAHAFGSLLRGKSDFKVFSFYANKNITCGEGGMVVCRDKKLAEEVRVLSAQGLSLGAWGRYGSGPVKRYSVEKIGLKGNLPDLLAAIGLTQLRRWPEMRSKRLNVWQVYEKAFGSMGVGHSMHFYPLRVKKRDLVREKLHAKGIGTGIHYKPLHLEPAYRFLGYERGSFPKAEAWGSEELSLPVSSNMTEKDALRVVDEIKKIKGEENGI